MPERPPSSRDLAAEIDPDLAVARGHAQQIAAARRMTTHQLLRQARHLSLGRRQLANRDRFAKWLEQLGIRPGQAELLLRVDSLFGTAEASEQLDAAALLLLAGPDVADAAVNHALYCARQGQLVTADQARALIARYAPAPDTAMG